MNSVGFLRTGAPFLVDLNLVVQLAMGVTLLAGRRLARLQRFHAHGRCQAAVMLLNLVMIGILMVPSFSHQVAPNLNKVTGDANYGVAATHAALGSIAELLGLYVVMVAMGIKLVPAPLRFRNYRAWMRTTLAMWWIVIAFGAGTYYFWYMREGRAAVAAAPMAAAATTVNVHNFQFEPKVLTVPAGTTVTWTDELGRHTVESADGFLKSDTLIAGGTYQKKFNTAGVYDYFCGNHGNKDGTGMTGRIVVTAR
jgi:plastocyanin